MLKPLGEHHTICLFVPFQAMARHGKSICTVTQYIDQLEKHSEPTRLRLAVEVLLSVEALCNESGGGSLAKMRNFILHHVSPFCMIFFHYTTCHFGTDRYIFQKDAPHPSPSVMGNL